MPIYHNICTHVPQICTVQFQFAILTSRHFEDFRYRITFYFFPIWIWHLPQNIPDPLHIERLACSLKFRLIILLILSKFWIVFPKFDVGLFYLKISTFVKFCNFSSRCMSTLYAFLRNWRCLILKCRLFYLQISTFHFRCIYHWNCHFHSDI